MDFTFNFQINPDSNRKRWDKIPPRIKRMPGRDAAVRLAQKTARLYKAEVRLTEGLYPYTTSGSYFRYNDY